MGWGSLGWDEFVVRLLPWAAYVPWAAWLAWTDLTERRLPDRGTLTAAAVVGAYSLYDGSVPAFLFGAAAWAGVYAAVAVAKPAAMGGGDVKLALSLGGATGIAAGVHATLVAMAVAGMLTAVTGAVTRSRHVAHGPSMLIACAGVALGGPMA